MLDRRQFLTGVVGGALGGLTWPQPGAAQLSVYRNALTAFLSDRLTVVTSGGTNVVTLSTADGLVLVDSGAPEYADPLMNALRQLSAGRRIKTLYNTHWHLEHTGANERLRQEGATIVAHANTRLWMATPTWMPDEDKYRTPRPPMAHPSEIFYGERSTAEEGERIECGYLLEAHTSGDIYVFFRDSNVLAVGDVASPARDPELDYLTGAWIGGRVDAMDRLIAISNDSTRIVPGFGPVMSRAELRAERDVMKIIYDRTVDRVRQGDYVEDMLAAGVLNGLARTWKDPRRFIHDVHKGLWAHHNKLSPDVV